MKTVKSILKTTFLFCFAAILFTACDPTNIDDTSLTPLWDCPNIEANSGDDCVYTVEVNGQTLSFVSTINEDCECQEVELDCPDLNLTIDDPCPQLDGSFGIVSVDCECVGSEWECPVLEANIGYDCIMPSGNVGVVNNDCECELPFPVDCPDYGANIGDSCTTGTGLAGVVSPDCECLEVAFDCPDLGLNVGDDCFNPVGGPGIVSGDCECIVDQVDCTAIGLNIGDPCTYTIMVNGQIVTITSIVTADCECDTSVVPDCPNLGLDIGVLCPLDNHFGYVTEDCNCEYQCPDLELNVGDDCLLTNGNYGSVTADCNCI